MKLAGLAAIFATASAEVDWQKVGQCGVPSKRPNSNIFESIESRSAGIGGGSDFNEDLGRIVGGQEAAAHSWPWQTHLSVCGKWYGMLECNICGGSLIHPKWVVSAAHCVPSSASGTMILGAHSISYGGKQRIPVKKFNVHPSWNTPAMFDNDISILELASSATITAEVSPICLPHATTCFETRTPCVVTGWGLTDERGGFPDKLQEVAVRIMDKDQCKSYKGYENVSPQMTCAGYEGGAKDACAGDSGGPLVCRLTGGAWVLYGVVSWGYGCARPGSPGVYANVPILLDFVRSITNLKEDPNLAMANCAAYNDDQDAEWKENNKNVWATLTPPWLTATPANVVVTEAAAACNYEKTSGGESVFTSGKGTITSENYPRSYPNDADCSYQLTNSDPTLYIRVTVKRAQMDCADRVIVTPKSGRVYKLCRVRRPLSFSDPSSIDIAFTSNHQRGGAGFTLDYEFKSAFMMCAGPDSLSLTRKSKRIRSENYPRLYSQSSQCRWHATSSDGKPINFYIRLFRTERNSNCNSQNDNMVIFDAPDCNSETLKTAPIWGTLCGYKSRSRFNTQLRSACFAFIADGDKIRNRGFELHLYTRN